MTRAAAKALLDARQTGTLVARDALEGVTGLATAYEVQKAQLALSGEEIAGWKIGATSQGAQAILGVDRPVFGPVAAQTLVRSGARCAIHPAHAHFIECEFALRLAADLPARATPWTRAEVAAAVAAIHAGFEVVSCRLEGGPKGAAQLVVADFGVNGGAVLGGEIARADRDRIAALPVSLEKNGEAVASGTAEANLWEHVLDAGVWMADMQDRAARGLRAGDLILTGTCTGLVPVAPGDRLRARFGDIALVETAFFAG